ncbi:MAG: NADPH-dependent F420 reductase [Pseudomonadota bacterium]|jgi:8-hydroxy-5-deazaflavin:NADPH oxidoreductase
MSDSRPTLAILGGSGDLGGGLAFRWARAGYPVIIGSRSTARAEEAAAALRARGVKGEVRGLDNQAAAAAGDLLVLTVPFASQASTLEAVREQAQGKILIDVTVPLVPPKVGTVQLPAEGSAGQIAQNLLGPGVRVVSAFQNVAAAHLEDPEHDPDCDVLVCGDDAESCRQVLELVAAAGMKGWHAGPIANAAAAEAMTSVLITLNRRYRIPGAGFRITGTPQA